MAAQLAGLNAEFSYTIMSLYNYYGDIHVHVQAVRFFLHLGSLNYIVIVNPLYIVHYIYMYTCRLGLGG